MKKFNISARLKIIFFSIALVSLQLGLELSLGKYFDKDDLLPYIQAFIVAVVFYISAWIVLRFRRNRAGHLAVILPTALSVFLISAFAYLLFEQLGVRVIYRTISILGLAVLWGYFYIVLLMVNILFKSILSPLPLAKAARTAMYITSVFSIFIATIILLSLPIHPVFPIILSGLVVLIYVFVNLWFTELRDKDSARLGGLAASIVMLTVFVLLNWPVSAIFIALLVSIFVYVFIGIVINILSGTLNRGMWFEYFLLIFLATFIILKVSDWGINKIPFI
ncbi:hypothetical protein KC660_02000 [Candidatus Dojkabacteria bacterium]|uniref:Uncharacterized protein n=1 Tax=Candidatus Dojkabacteria bacterium TaxID=2099670 RepID=A0A955L3F0_9BACT|nr:hypothetical protein [Candidatus Dojkabacteria bacterium]